MSFYSGFLPGGVVPTQFPINGIVPVTVQTGTTYTPSLNDVGSVIEFTNAAAVTVTIPPLSTVGWQIGSIININCQGAGGLTISPGGGVTIQNNSAALTQWEECSLRYSSTVNQWIRVG